MTRKPGILMVALYEGQGLQLPEEMQSVLPSPYEAVNQTASFFSPYRRRAYSSSSNSMQPNLLGSRVGEASTDYRRSRPSNLMPYALLDFDKVQVFMNSIAGSPRNPSWAGPHMQYKFDVSRVTPLTVHLYVRNPNAPPGSGRSQDICIGSVRIVPCFDHPNKEIHWLDVQGGTGKLQLSVEYAEPEATKLTIHDFELLKVVGKGAFGKVMQVRKKDTGRIYALKTIRKEKIINKSEVEHTLAERSVLSQIDNPFIIPLKFSFQTPQKLYFVLAFVNGGELFYHLRKERRFNIPRSRFYAAELLCALECLHSFNVIYRDLKPENILLDYQGHIALCDFGLCKIGVKDGEKTNTFCGTAEYLAPELLTGQGYDKTVDWWTLGILLFEMLVGLPPFYDDLTKDMVSNILNMPLYFNSELISPTAKDLIQGLLDRNPQTRLGARGAAEIKAHPFFHSIDWKKIIERKYEPAFKPNVVCSHPLLLPFFSNAISRSCLLLMEAKQPALANMFLLA